MNIIYSCINTAHHSFSRSKYFHLLIAPTEGLITLDLPPNYFYWFRINIKHMTEPWLDQAIMDPAYRSEPRITELCLKALCTICSGCWEKCLHIWREWRSSGLEPHAQFASLHLNYSSHCWGTKSRNRNNKKLLCLIQIRVYIHSN